jgi:carbon storage regulator CsrA
MLVISRGEGDGVHFPDLDLAVRVLKVAGQRIRIGIDAPDHVRVLRSELLQRSTESSIASGVAAGGESDATTHAERNRLNAAGLALSLAQKHLERNRPDLAEQALKAALARLQGEIAPSSAAEAGVGHVLDGPTAVDRRAMSVLVVEDNRNEGQLLADLLRMNGFVVRTAEDGLAALEAMQQQVPDAVLLDMHMPRCDGPDTLRRIREDRRFDSVLLYAVSGASAREMDLTTCEEGVRRWFQKPVQSVELVQSIRQELTSTASV